MFIFYIPPIFLFICMILYKLYYMYNFWFQTSHQITYQDVYKISKNIL